MRTRRIYPGLPDVTPGATTKILVTDATTGLMGFSAVSALQTTVDGNGLATDADVTALSASIASVAASIGVSGSYSTQDKFFATNNGNGTNYKVGDDAWIGDVNATNTMQVSGVEDSSKGYIKFGSGAGTPVIGTSGVNHLNITNIPVYANNTAAIAGGLAVGDIYRNGDNLGIVH
jgi:hypothetical protein